MKTIIRFILTYVIIASFLSLFTPGKAFCISVKEEEDLSREFMKAVLKHYELIDDPLLVKYVGDIGAKILAAAPPQPFVYRFHIVNNESYNAFAGPGGHIFIHSGLFEAMDSEEELAGILAHEISHVICRHISDRYERSKKIEMATLAGMAAGILLGATGGAEAVSQAITIGSAAAGQSLSLAYSRDDEMQADQIGLDYLNKSGYTGEGIVTVLKKIRDRRWFGSAEVPAYLTTHPAVEERIGYLDAMVEKKSAQTVKKLSYNPDNFKKAHTRLRVMYGNEENILRILEQDVTNHPDDPMAHYRYGLILSKSGNRMEAINHFKKALEQKAFDPDILRDLGKTYFQDGRYSEAQKILEGSISLSPDEPEALFVLGRIGAETGKLEVAKELFLTITEKYPYYKQALYFLGETCGKMGNMADAHYYLGLYYSGKEDIRNALFHLEKALQETVDQDRKIKIEEMLNAIKKKKSKEAKEESEKAPKPNRPQFIRP
ncbi:MAG: tetratricopeptide repeat protein [Desulfobacteraceae bacterium]|nr:MAG: tetratricopeptide repeat protein [Desulfobacteraceae bacterium]